MLYRPAEVGGGCRVVSLLRGGRRYFTAEDALGNHDIS